jgi:FdhD protein
MRPPSEAQSSAASLRVWPAAGAVPALDHVAEEVPVALLYNGAPHVVMMCSPADLEDFARGFSVTEDIVQHPQEIISIHILALPEQCGYEINLQIPAARAEALGSRQRNLQGRTGCGLCGAQTLAEAARIPRHVAAGERIAPAAIRRALAALQGQQPLNQLTGATHAAAWANARGELLAVREDVGRHNALDKLIGHLLAAGTDCALGFALITSRASYEMVQKAARAGMPVLVAISAPTAYAVRMAEEAGLTLIGFARQERHVIYSCPGRVLDELRLQA